MPASALSDTLRSGWAILAGAALIAAIGWAWLLARRMRQQRVEQLVRERTAEIERADAAKTSYFTQLSHEIRNPLNGLLGASLALDAGNLSPAQRKQARTVHDCAALLSSLVDNVLDFARIESGVMDLRHEPFDPRAMLAAVVRILHAQADAAGVRLSVVVAPDVPELVIGDAARVQQIVVNFTLNAIKFAPGAPVELMLALAHERLEFSVADRGRGIPDAEKARLFARFSRLSAARDAGIAGTGLGLAVSRALAERMGGTVGVRDRDDGGTLFWLQLACSAAQPVQAAAAPVTREFEGARALIVEDLDYNATALEYIATSLGFRCDRARTAEDALHCLSEQAYTAVFVDCDLPGGKNGIDLVCAAKSVARVNVPLFIATSAHAAASARQACLDAGMDAFVAKPITPERLSLALRAFAPPLRGAASVHVPPRAQLLPTEMIDYLGDGTEEGRAQSRRRFAEAVHECIDRLVAAQRVDDRETVRRAAHQLISLARMVGAPELSAGAEQLEDLAASAVAPELAQMTARLAARALDVTSALRIPEAATLVA